MHVTTKEVVADKETREKYPDVAEGAHVLTSTIEGDGPLPIASELATFHAEVLSTVRTASGGVEVKIAVEIDEPAPVAVEPVKAEVVATPEETAVAYLVSKGTNEADAEAHVAKFGAARILAARDKELDAELQASLAPEHPAA